MSIVKLGRISRPGSPNIYLTSVYDDLISVCLTASDKSEDIAGQTRQILKVIDEHLSEVGSARDKVLMAQVWIGDMGMFAAFRDVWNAWIDPEAVPALSVVVAAASRRDSLLEIRAYAAVGG